MKLKHLVFVSSLLALSANSYGASFGNFDPRSMAMGGTGVASGTAGSASYYNPALLATPLKYNGFTLVLPTVAIGLADPKDLRDAADNFNNGNYANILDADIQNYNNQTTTQGYITNSATVATDSQNLLNGLNTLSNKAVSFGVDAGVVAAVPSQTFGFAVSGIARAVGGAVLNITPQDQQLMQSYINVLKCIGTQSSTSTPSQIQTNCDPTGSVIGSNLNVINSNINNTLTSSVDIRGALIQEVAVSMAHNFDTPFGPIAIGITPKATTVKTFDYAANVNTTSISTSTGEKDYSDMNLDIGAAKNLTQDIKVGLVAKNILSKSYKTVLGNTVNIDPQYRAGIEYQNSWVLLTGDMDLTTNKGIGFENDSQYAAVGAELNVLDFLQLRAGLRHNMKNNAGVNPNIVSAGVGVNLYIFQIDLGVAKNNNEVAAGLQISSEW